MVPVTASKPPPIRAILRRQYPPTQAARRQGFPSTGLVRSTRFISMDRSTQLPDPLTDYFTISGSAIEDAD
ncbi:MAG: hypothetical protein KY475_07195 [Planctomycetes bacterium]|nr:hypothetical protein [Planctomycetota bacterium]